MATRTIMGIGQTDALRPSLLRRSIPVLAIVLVTTVCLAPFADKAFHIDDTLFLRVARQILRDPLNFYGVSVNWHVTTLPIWQITKNPPLAAYYLALAAWFFGWHEVPLHLAFLVPAIVAIATTYLLADKLCHRPALAALAALLTPAFLVSGTSVMCDILMLAFWTSAILCWFHGMERERFALLVLAGFLAALGFWTKYFAISLVPLFLVDGVARRRPMRQWLMPLAIPAVAALLYGLITYRIYGFNLLREASSFAVGIQERSASDFPLWAKLVMGLAFPGACLSSALFYFPFLWPRRGVIAAIGFFLFVAWSLYLLGRIGPFALRAVNHVHWAWILQEALWCAAGFQILALAGMDLWENRNAEALLLFVWVFGTWFFAAFVNWTINARSVLPAAPAVGILLMRRLDLHLTGVPGARLLLALPLVPAAGLALAVAHADYAWANSAREAAQNICRDLSNQGGTIWFEGHWGFQYYMEEAGARSLDLKNVDCAPGDLIIIPLNNCNLFPLPPSSVHTLEPLRVHGSTWFALMQYRVAGFYAGGTGPLPFVLERVPEEEYRRLKVIQPIIHREEAPPAGG